MSIGESRQLVMSSAERCQEMGGIEGAANRPPGDTRSSAQSTAVLSGQVRPMDKCDTERRGRFEPPTLPSVTRHLSNQDRQLQHAAEVSHISEPVFTQMYAVPSGGEFVSRHRSKSNASMLNNCQIESGSEEVASAELSASEVEIEDDESVLAHAINNTKNQHYLSDGKRAVNTEHRDPLISRTGTGMPPGPAHNVDEFGVLTFNDDDAV